MSATRVLRERTAFLSDAVDRKGGAGAAASAAVVGVTVVIATYPTTAGAYYGITPQRILGTNAEGDSATFESELDDATTMVALNVGTQVPPAGTKVICEGVGGRWVFRYDG